MQLSHNIFENIFRIYLKHVWFARLRLKIGKGFIEDCIVHNNIKRFDMANKFE